MARNSTTYTDQQLFQGIKARDREVLAFVNRKYRPLIRLLIHKMGGSVEDAKDIFQDGMLAIIRKTEDPGFRLTSSLKTLLCAICKNLWKYKSRMKHRVVELVPELHDDVEVPAFEHAEDRWQLEELFWGHLRLLPRTCREVLDLYLKRLQYSEIARRLNMTEAYVRKRKSHCSRLMIQAIRLTAEYKKLSDYREFH